MRKGEETPCIYQNYRKQQIYFAFKSTGYANSRNIHYLQLYLKWMLPSDVVIRWKIFKASTYLEGGVAIAWKKQYSHLIDELPDGNERILAIAMKHPINLCIISAYMPTNNSSDSYIVYLECFDVIKDIIAKYSASHSILLSGDMNGTLKEPRKYNKHDALLQSFIEEINLRISPSVMPTLYHHSGGSTSQIDYILHNSHDGFLFNYTVNNKCDINISSHVPVSASLNINWNGKQIVKKSNQTTWLGFYR